MSYVLKNPRSYVKSASIHYEKLFDKWVLSVETRNAGKVDYSNSLTSAKRLFSTHILEPKYWGKNIWERKK